MAIYHVSCSVKLSLQAQGCIFPRLHLYRGLQVVPASAGLYRPSSRNGSRSSSCPCKRRVVSEGAVFMGLLDRLSLQAQGCIGMIVVKRVYRHVVPASAGLYHAGEG